MINLQLPRFGEHPSACIAGVASRYDRETQSQAIFSQWLPAAGCTLEVEPNFEVYTDQFDPHTGTGLVEIWIPLKAGSAE